jgi:predicted NBD/HSP70 family sugar kinase
LFVVNTNKLEFTMSRQSADHSLMRTINRSLILSQLRTSAPLSRADLAARIGLTRSTVSSQVDELIAANLVHETGTGPSHGGRPGTLLELNPAGGCAVGIELTSESILVLLTDFVAQPRWQREIALTDHDPDAVLAQTEALIDEALAYNAATENTRPLGIGLGTAGLVNAADGVLRSAYNLGLGWRDIPFKTLWERRFRLPVHVGNEATIAALGEHYFGAAAGYRDFIYLQASTSALGAGIFIDGKLYQGMGGYAGEVGHIVIDPAGARCTCGKRGCWEAVLRAASSSDRIAVLATGIAGLVNIFNPPLVVLGGPLGRSMQPALGTLREQVATQVTMPTDSLPEIAVSTMTSNACAMGAVALVLDDILRESPF